MTDPSLTRAAVVIGEAIGIPSHLSLPPVGAQSLCHGYQPARCGENRADDSRE
jgi:hypothetical protein